MSIDEVIRKFEDVLHEAKEMCDTPMEIFYSEALNYLKYAKWYINQDMIPRDMAYSILLRNGKEHYLNNGMHNDEVTSIIDKMIAELGQIPKAEPLEVITHD